MNKKIVKIMAFILLIVLSVGCIATTVSAVNGMVTPEDVANQMDYGTNNDGILKIAGKVMGFIRNIAVIGGVIILMILGVKYMVGSTEEKADYKKSLIPLIVGILIVMAASTIMSFVINMFT